MQDCEIIELYFARDERAIAATSEKYGTYCTKIAINILNDIFESEECVNDTYMRVWNAIPPTKPNIFRAFLAKITRNIALDRLSSKNSKKRGSRFFESLDELEECVGNADIADSLESDEITKILNKFLYSERELVRRIFIRRYFYLDSVKTIAKMHGIGEGRVKTILFRAREKLAELLSKEGIFI